jgi:transcriptional regulator with XRE-family HTH domain
MSLGDYLRLLRARHGGTTPWEIEMATGLTRGLYRQMEQRYRAMGDDDSIRALAEFYGAPFDDLRWRLDWPRKILSRTLVGVALEQRPITLYLWDGQVVTGKVAWWDLGAVALDTGAGALLIVQRHSIERWDPRIVGPDASADDDTEVSSQ